MARATIDDTTFADFALTVGQIFLVVLFVFCTFLIVAYWANGPQRKAGRCSIECPNEDPRASG